MLALQGFVWWLLRATLSICLCTLLGATMDHGHPAKGIFREDLPSTVGMLLGILISFVDLYLMW